MNSKTLKIGYKTYVIETPEEISEAVGDFYGTAHYDKEVIRIAGRRQGQHDKNCTFIHEMLPSIIMIVALLRNNKQYAPMAASGSIRYTSKDGTKIVVLLGKHKEAYTCGKVN